MRSRFYRFLTGWRRKPCHQSHILSPERKAVSFDDGKTWVPLRQWPREWGRDGDVDIVVPFEGGDDHE